MVENASLIKALECYEMALSLFRSGHFAKAQDTIREYRRRVDYSAFQRIDNRGGEPGYASVIIVTRDRRQDLLACLNSLKNLDPTPFEIIVVDNGSKSSLRYVLGNRKVILVECPIPLTPSEGRNIGAFHARADLLIFMDDDALAEPRFVKCAVQAFEEHPFLGIRGRILPISSNFDNSLAGLYDLGDYPLPALLDIEGNMAVPKALYHAVEGMNPLLFGAEGLDLTARLLAIRPSGDVYYWPGMTIKHDYVSGDKLLAKRQRQALVNEYLRVMHPHVLKVKERYAGLYRVCRKKKQGTFIKKLPVNIKTVGRDMSLALKSEKILPNLSLNSSLKKIALRSANKKDRGEVTQKETKALLKRVLSLEMELEITRKSLTFRLGQLIKDALSSPLRQGLLLPVRLGRLIKEYHARSGHVDFNTVKGVNGRKMRNKMQYAQPDKEGHDFTLFEEFESYINTRNSSLRIACILSSWMHSCLQSEAELIPLCLDDWQEVFCKRQPDFLLVQSQLDKSGSWQDYCVGADGPPVNLKKLMVFCKGEGIPTVFWDTEDYVHFPLFSKIAPFFDRVFAADPKSSKAYSKLLGSKAAHLGPAVQPALHNPFKPGDNNYNSFTILLDGWADILEDPAAFEFLIPMCSEGLHIIESRYRFMANKLDDLPAFRENIMGCVSFGSRLSILRYYRVFIMPKKSLSSPMTRSWQAMEALACGCCVVMSGRHADGIPEELVIRTDDDISLREQTLCLLKDDDLLMRHAHLARRTLYASHTYAHRIRAICDSLGIEHNWEEFPLVSVILSTKRPELIKSCLEKFHGQNYPNKELILVVNTDKVNLTMVQRLVDEFPNVHVFQMHQEKNIGSCLNFGVAQARGKYWFKMDDDDLYGPNYLIDMVHLAIAVDFDILGKPPSFIYIKDEDKLYLRNNAVQFQHTVDSFNIPHLCGATLGGKRDRFLEFSENHRACVDTGFVENGKAMDRIMVVGDIWNFIAFRSGDKNGHTWRHDDEGIIKNAVPFGKGLMLEKVMI
jgi:glycosyltransferase involved in cell wall biosynthesis